MFFQIFNRNCLVCGREAMEARCPHLARRLVAMLHRGVYFKYVHSINVWLVSLLRGEVGLSPFHCLFGTKSRFDNIC